MSATTQDALARLAEPRKLSASSKVAVENPAAFSRSCVALRIDLSSSTIATSGPSGISPRAVERSAYAALSHLPIARRRAALTPWYNALSGARRAEPVSHAHQLGNRFRPHLAHHLPPVDLYGDDAQPELGRDLLVHPSRHDELHDLPLALGKLVVTRHQRREARRVAAPCAIALDRRMDRIEQHLIVERLGEELGRAGLHRTHGHRNVAVSGDEDDRESDTCFRKLLLKREPAHAGQPHVEHEAGRYVGPLRLHEFLGRREKLHVEPYRLEKTLKRAAHGWIVIDDEDYCALAHGTLAAVCDTRGANCDSGMTAGRSPTLASAE